MIKLDVSLNESDFSFLKEKLHFLFEDNKENILPETKKAFDLSARFIQRVWQGFLSGESIEGIPDINHPNPSLSNSFKIHNVSPFDSVIGSESEYVKRIESGTPKIDMKKTYPYGRKSHISKKNVAYLVIPFCWEKEEGKRVRFGNTIPKIAYDIMRGGKKTFESSFRLFSQGVKGKSRFTFRVISAKSPENSWIRKEIPGIDISSAIEKEAIPIVKEMIQKGIEKDLNKKKHLFKRGFKTKLFGGKLQGFYILEDSFFYVNNNKKGGFFKRWEGRSLHKLRRVYNLNG